MFKILNFPISKAIRFMNNNNPKNCFALKYMFNPKFSYYIFSNKCDCVIWCKYPPSNKPCFIN